jgi:hypothetical protein
MKRLEKSGLFGDMPISSLYDTDKPAVPSPTELMPLPWMSQLLLGSSIMEKTEATAPAASEPMDVDSAATTSMVGTVDEEFTLKKGLKRKASSAREDDLVNSESDDFTMAPTRGGDRQTKRRKATPGSDTKPQTTPRRTETEHDNDVDSDGQDDEGDIELASDEAEANTQLSKKEMRRLKKRERRRQKKGTKGALGEQDDDRKAGGGVPIEGKDSSASPDVEQSPGGDSPLEGATDQETINKEAERSKREARAQRKMEKAAAAAKATKTAAIAEDDEPFDYSKTASVLHAPSGGAGSAESSRGKKGKKDFDPYAKSDTHAIKGARKAPPVAGSRSAVFKK